MAFCFLFSAPATSLAFEGNPSMPEITPAAFEADKKLSFKLSSNPATWQAEDNNQCVDQCMQKLMQCMFGAGGTPKGGDKCDNEFNQCISKCDQNNPENKLSQLQMERQ